MSIGFHSRRLTLALGLGAALASSASFAAPVLSPFEARIDLLETQAQDLANRLNIPARKGFGEPTVQVAQSNRSAAQINVRLDALEGQMRTLNGQVEGMQFQLTQLQALLTNMQADNEFRFQELEGGSLGKTSAVTQSGSETLASELPQNIEVDDGPLGPAFSLDSNLDQDLSLGPDGELGSLSGEGLDLSLEGAGKPFDLLNQSGSVVRNGDADAQYRAGFDAAASGDTIFAEGQFRQFIALFPNHPDAPNATHWLGEALLQRGDYEEAAEILLEGFELYPNSVKAPDMLLKLGVSLGRAGEHETACRTFVEALRRYPNGTRDYMQQIGREQKNAQC